MFFSEGVRDVVQVILDRSSVCVLHPLRVRAARTGLPQSPGVYVSVPSFKYREDSAHHEPTHRDGQHAEDYQATVRVLWPC
jgi:hypothetical protein